MLDTTTKRRIDDCRDILVGKLPDPKAQIEQITIGLIYKFMDDMDKEAVELGGQAKFFSDYKVPDPEFPNDRNKDKVIEFSKYAWDKLMHPKVTASEMLALYSEAIEGMEKNPNIPQLFRDIFNNAYLPYRDPETLKLFLKTISEFEYTHSEKLGDAFEYLLSVMGSQGDAGQFRTPRHIIDFLVAIIDPDKSDTIMDPACGTAGFLISAYKHILLKYTRRDKACLVPTAIVPTNIYQYNQLPDDQKYPLTGDQLTPDDRKKLIQNFVGYDISPDMVRLSLVNLYLHGFNTPNIHEYDTLSSEERWNESFDVVLANPPFMSPKGGIRPHKKFTISSNRSEVLFVDYIAEHLNPNGKAGIIVPEGIIFQSGTAYKALRQLLVENHLYAVVSLPAGVFNPYSGVKTSILLIDKEIAKKREEILFIKIDNDGYNLGAQRTAVRGGQLEEAIKLAHKFVETGEFEETDIAHLVPKAEIAKNGDYNLTGDRYRNIEILSSVFEFKELCEVCKINPESIEPCSLGTNEFIYIDISSVENGSGFVSYDNVVKVSEAPSRARRKVKHNDIALSTVRPNLKAFGFIQTPPNNTIASTGFAILRANENINSKFLFYNLFTDNMVNQMIGMMGKGAYPSINQSDVSALKIPLPPLSIQEEIVAEIEGYQKIIDGAKAVVANYKPKIEIDPDWEMAELGEVCEIKSGGTPSRQLESYWNGSIPWVGSTVCKDTYVNSAEEFITDEGLKNSSAKLFEDGTTLIALVGATIGKTGFLTFKSTTNQNIAGLTPKDENDLDKKYLYFACQSIYNNFMRLGEGKFRMATLSFVREQKIAVPPINIQRQIVAQIEKEQELVNANKQLIEIFEQKIKDRIAKVWGTSTSLSASSEMNKKNPYGERGEAELGMVAESNESYQSS